MNVIIRYSVAIVLIAAVLTVVCLLFQHMASDRFSSRQSVNSEETQPGGTVNFYKTESSGSMDVCNDFAIELYREVRKGREGNFFFSPFSVQLSMNILARTAVSDRQNECYRVLRYHTESDAETFSQAAQSLASFNTQKMRPSNLWRNQSAVSEQDKLVEMNISLDWWYTQGNQMSPETQKMITGKYGVPINQTQLYTSGNAAKALIDSTVSDKTKGLVTELFKDQTSIDGKIGFLTDIVSFKASWLASFPEENTEDRVFTPESGTALKVPTMSYEEYFQTTVNEEVSVLSCDYVDRHYAMLFILPKADKTLAQIEERLSSNVLRSWLEKLEYHHKVLVQIPKFEIKTSLSLKEILETLGNRDPGEQENKTKHKSASLQLPFSDIIQETCVTIDEKGTSAVAASLWGCLALDEREDFLFNRPFLFLIYEKRTNLILFMGRIKTIEQGSSS